MKSLALSFAVLLSVLVPHMANAAKGDLHAPRWIYQALSETFPEFVESIGGFSYEIDLSHLTCSSSNSLKGNEPVVLTECTATDRSGKSITRSATSLFLSLLNIKSPLDRVSEAGTSYIELKSLNCALIDPKPSSPDQVSEPSYSCSVGKIEEPDTKKSQGKCPGVLSLIN